EDAVVLGQEIPATLRRSAPDQARTRNCAGQTNGGFIFVEVAVLQDDHRDRPDRGARVGGEGLDIGLRETPALRPAHSTNREVAGENGACERRSATPRDQPLEAQPPWLSRADRARPRSPASCTPPPSPSGTRRRRG